MASWIEFLQLCGAATYRDGLFSILEAGITHLDVPELPARHQLTVVARLAFTEPDTNRLHVATVEVEVESHRKTVGVTTEIDTTRPPDADLAFPYTYVLIHNLLLELDEEGLYTIAVSLDQDAGKQLSLRVRRAQPA